MQDSNAKSLEMVPTSEPLESRRALKVERRNCQLKFSRKMIQGTILNTMGSRLHMSQFCFLLILNVLFPFLDFVTDWQLISAFAFPPCLVTPFALNPHLERVTLILATALRGQSMELAAVMLTLNTPLLPRAGDLRSFTLAILLAFLLPT